ncbi:MAG: DJ-1/PfpI family protein [Acidobacteria bacterium]|nr:DJ-1/PfpI family protein [Acidobacteriota bacterium]
MPFIGTRARGRLTRLAVPATLVLGLLLAVPALAQAPVSRPDFDGAMRGLGFDPVRTDANLDTSEKGNGIPDADEMALVAAVLATPSLDLRASGGVDHQSVRAAFEQALAAANADIAPVRDQWPTAPLVAAGYSMLGQGSHTSYDAMSATFGVPLKGDYSRALALQRLLAFDGDADGDGVTNLDEYRAAASREAYVKAALDPKARAASTTARTATAPAKKVVGIVLYPDFEVLDVFGPLEMWAYVPEFQVVMIAETAGPVRSYQGVSTVADYSFATAPPVDILMVPGGIGTRAQLTNPALLDYIRQQHARTTYTTSVCTGSALLAKAGILTGHKATSNKGAFALAVEQDLSVNWIVKARWVEDGKFLTSSGVSAGTDMALGLVARMFGRERAAGLARSLEYEWNADASHDPFAIAAVPAVRKK